MGQFFVYILYSSSIDKYYVGQSENMANRIAFHNDGARNKIWTRRGIPWELKIVFGYESKTESLKAEKFIKNQKSRIFIEKRIAGGWNCV
ncbi:GIY-YIG nuclease family protein [Rhodonellum sp.]|uniref:GIY-YIG nuclease family protein n=1 Tax=Rhodonellum sp. TaxID=2231180 RepID=UPI002718B4A3|nr:GIY-YIG nuclease family protein [Rhodonellum sp.]MDO9552132.1 GIY-YIG nuclease family protein [Rhodonellum sp.]